MKRALLIATGTVGSLGAVMAITPPQISTTSSLGTLGGASLGGSKGAQATPVASHTSAQAAPAPTKSATKATPTTSVAANTTTNTAAPAASASATPTASATSTQAATSGVSGSYTGDTFQASRYGNVVTRVTLSNGKITSVSASQSPSSWSNQSLSVLIPYVNSGKITVEQIKQYSAQQLPCALSNSCRSSASFTATAFWESLKSALTKAHV
jgi:hypothetical protein